MHMVLIVFLENIYDGDGKNNHCYVSSTEIGTNLLTRFFDLI